MFGRPESRYPQIADLQRGVRTLDRMLSRMREATADGMRSVADNGRDTAVGAFDDVAERFRTGAERVGKEAMRLGHRATALGEMSIDRLAKDVGLHPLIFLGIALGVGAIIGAARYRYAVQNPRPRKPQPRVRKGNRK